MNFKKPQLYFRIRKWKLENHNCISGFSNGYKEIPIVHILDISNEFQKTPIVFQNSLFDHTFTKCISEKPNCISEFSNGY